MKKINSIRYGHRILTLAGILLLVAPMLSGFVILFLVGLLAVEFHQDRRIDRQYPRIQRTKMVLAGGAHECQTCGNRRLASTDAYCSVCGTTFDIERSDLRCPV